MHLGVLATHPIQYQAPLFRHLAQNVDLQVFFSHLQTPEGQARAGFGVEFEWDVPLLDGYEYQFLRNASRNPDVSTFFGCDTPEISNVIGQKRFDAFLLMGWYNKSYLQALRACKRSGTAVMVRGDSQLLTPRSRLKYLAKELGYRLFLQQFDACLYVGQRSREYFVHYGVSEHQLFFSPHFVDDAYFRSEADAVRSDRDSIRCGLGLNRDDIALLFVGKFIQKKRPNQVLEAAARLSEMGLRVKPVFVGGGAMEEQLRSRARELRVDAIFAGFKNQSELPEIYVAGDILVLPSDGGETWGLVVNEAMACGLPAAVSESVGCGPDLIREGETGTVFRQDDVSHLAYKLYEFVYTKRGGSSEAIRRIASRYTVSEACMGVLSALHGIHDR